MSPGRCNFCNRPGTLYCNDCATYDANYNIIDAHWYCSGLCKAADEPKHLGECRAHLLMPEELFRRAEQAGEAAQSLFYAFVQNTWAYDMSTIRIVRDQDDDVVAVEVTAGGGVHAGPGAESTCGRHAGGWLVKFPDAAFDIYDQEAKRAVLADQNSIWAFVSMHVAVEALFKGMSSSCLNCHSTNNIQ